MHLKAVIIVGKSTLSCVLLVFLVKSNAPWKPDVKTSNEHMKAERGESSCNHHVPDVQLLQMVTETGTSTGWGKCSGTSSPWCGTANHRTRVSVHLMCSSSIKRTPTILERGPVKNNQQKSEIEKDIMCMSHHQWTSHSHIHTHKHLGWPPSVGKSFFLIQSFWKSSKTQLETVAWEDRKSQSISCEYQCTCLCVCVSLSGTVRMWLSVCIRVCLLTLYWFCNKRIKDLQEESFLVNN